MKSTIQSLRVVAVILLLLVLPRLAVGQEAIALEEAQKGAQLLGDAAGRLADAAVAIDANVDKPFGIKAGGVGLIIIPDKALTAEKLSAAGSTITPVGQLWMKEVNIAVNGRSPSQESLRSYTVKAGDNDLRVRLYLVGAVKNAAGQVELVVYGQGREPLLHVPIEKSSSGSKGLPIEMTGRKNDDNTGTVTLHLPGQYQADILLVKAE